jgi:hypothetical protein
MWPFSKKKVPQVPFPKGHPMGEHVKMPSQPAELPPVKAPQKLAPEQIKEAAGIKEAAAMPPEMSEEPMEEITMPEPVLLRPDQSEPLFIKKDVYQRILGEIASLQGDLDNLHELNKDLEHSEFNEENHYAKVRRAVKSSHDRLVQVDNILFKS